MTQRLQILFVGDRDFPEFRQAFVVLQSLARVIPGNTPSAAAAELTAGLAADVIVLAFRRPGEFSSEDVDRLRRLAPTAPLVALLGSLCEGEARSGSPPAGVVRVYWHQWESAFLNELSRLSDGGCPRWGLPAAATHEDRQLCESPPPESPPPESPPPESPPPESPPPVASSGGVIAVQAQCREMERWLADTCRAEGYGTIRLSSDEGHTDLSRIGGIVAAIWEGDECGLPEQAEIRRLGDRCGGAPVLAILGFPRLEDRQRALTAAAGVLSKPVGASDLLAQLKPLVSG